MIGQDGGSSFAQSTFALTLEAYDLIDERTGDVINQRAHVDFVGLEVRGLAQPDLSRLPYQELMRRADGRGDRVLDRVEDLKDRITDLRLQIESRLQRRYALSLTAMLLLVLGSTLAMVLRDALPLVIYIWAFVPSILDVILISGGGHILKGGQVALGTVVLWSGNALLAAIIVSAYRRLIRN